MSTSNGSGRTVRRIRDTPTTEKPTAIGSPEAVNPHGKQVADAVCPRKTCAESCCRFPSTVRSPAGAFNQKLIFSIRTVMLLNVRKPANAKPSNSRFCYYGTFLRRCSAIFNFRLGVTGGNVQISERTEMYNFPKSQVLASLER